MTIFHKGISLIVTLSIALAPFSSQAWFFPTVSAQGSGDVLVSDKNAQNLELLAPRVTMASDRRAVDDTAGVTIVDGEALSADMGTSGSLADVMDDAAMGDISVYVVKSGDNVATVAKLFGVTENTVRWTNGMSKTDVLHVGDTLLIMPFNGIKYTVAKGDTLAGIEKKFSLTSEEIGDLLSYNDLESGARVVIGQTLYIPGAELNTASVAVKTSGGAKAKTSSTVSSKIIRGYFIRPLPWSCRESQNIHDRFAIDIACPTGTPIRAAASGVVEFAADGWNGAYGGLIILKHSNGTRTYYAHNQVGGIVVSKGESVSQGQVIGHVGSTGRSTGPHLHFEVRDPAGGRNPGFDRTGSAWKQ